MMKSPKTIADNRNTVPNKGLPLAAPDEEHFIETVRESLHIKSHFELLLWLQGDFQRCIPHEIFIAAWGNFSNGSVRHDLVSAIPGVRTGRIADSDISQFVGQLFDRWVAQGSGPFGARFDGLQLGPATAGREELEAFKTMRSVLVHGIRDARGRNDCLYVFLNTDPAINGRSLDDLRMTLPFIDVATRQVAHLPSQYGGELRRADDVADLQEDLFLSEREREILNWVKVGKTNYEVGIILNISTFTVKNHLQRIFRKLNVTNRAQAASKMKAIKFTVQDTEAESAIAARVRQMSKQAG